MGAENCEYLLNGTFSAKTRRKIITWNRNCARNGMKWASVAIAVQKLAIFQKSNIGKKWEKKV